MSDFGATANTVGVANGGLDQEMAMPVFFAGPLWQAIQSGQVSVALLEDKVRRILRSMFALGLFDQPAEISSLPVPEHGQRAREIGGKSIVLLKNDGGLLPLASEKLTSVAVIGADAGNLIVGNGSSLV